MSKRPPIVVNKARQRKKADRSDKDIRRLQRNVRKGHMPRKDINEMKWRMKSRPHFTQYPRSMIEKSNLKNGVRGMADRIIADSSLKAKIDKMDEGKLMEIYDMNPNIFEVVFDYEGITYDSEFGVFFVDKSKEQVLENFVGMYEEMFGKL